MRVLKAAINQAGVEQMPTPINGGEDVCVKGNISFIGSGDPVINKPFMIVSVCDELNKCKLIVCNLATGTIKDI